MGLNKGRVHTNVDNFSITGRFKLSSLGNNEITPLFNIYIKFWNPDLLMLTGHPIFFS